MTIDGDDVAGMVAGSSEVVDAGSETVDDGAVGTDVAGGSVVVGDVPGGGGAPVVGLVGGTNGAGDVGGGPGVPGFVAPVGSSGAVVPGVGDAQPAGICAEAEATVPDGVLFPPPSALRREAPGRSPRRRDSGVRSQFTPSMADCPV